MPPDADTLRQRHKPVLDGEDDAAAPEQTITTQERLCTLSELKTHEVCIDGVIYDLEGFDHPGGESIMVFGGNDVTVQYKMIHAYHTDKHLEKMRRVGKVVDYESEYKFDTPFELEIKREVFKIVRRGREYATPGYLFRAACYIGFYFYLQYLWITRGSSWQLAIIYGLAQAAIGMNVQHDANHGAVSAKYPILNDILGLGADFIGGSKWLWMEQHWTHHAYTNHAEKDPDSFATEPLFVFNNYPKGHPKRRWYHKFQAFYYLAVLAGYWISSVFNPQILDLRQRGALSVGIQMESDFVKSRRKYAIAIRLYYIFVHVVCPLQFHGVTARAIGDILLLGVAESLGLSVLFSLSHNFVHADRDPTNEQQRDADGKVCWFKSQVETSCTYGGAISGYLTGGLNFQVEHHLFPRMSSAWYPYIAPKVREICAKHDVNYAYYPWVWQNMWSTVCYVHEAGNAIGWESNPLSGNL